MARQLHQEASVPLGPCGHDALESFQTLLAPIESHVDIIPVHGDLSSLRFNSLTFDTRMEALLNVLWKEVDHLSLLKIKTARSL